MTIVTRSSEVPTPPAILTVNGNPDIRESFAQLLTSNGYEVETVSYGETGLERIQHRAFNAVILHDRLPDQDGLILLTTIRSIQPRLPVIVTTAAEAYPVIDDAFAVLVLPYRREELLDILQRAILATTTAI